jgi:hypothetical protein
LERETRLDSVEEVRKMARIREQLRQKMTITISRWRACLLVSSFVFSFSFAVESARRLIDAHRVIDALHIAFGSLIAVVAMLGIFLLAGDEMISPKRDSAKTP